MKTKQCIKCGIIKDVVEFNKHNSTSDGLDSWCKDCHKQYFKEWTKQHPDKIKHYRNTHNKNHPDYAKNYYNKNKHKIIKYNAKYRDTEDGYKHTWCSTLHRHKYKGISINITTAELFEYVKDINTCKMCGKILNWTKNGKKGATHDSPTLDRIDNEDYIDLNNIQILCYQCNAGKQKMTNDEYINQCKMVLENNGYIIIKK
jgi:5-methylcytosine-specific restriction endonuclease McrA